MLMGKRKRDRQVALWVTTADLPTGASHGFYRRFKLREHGFDDLAEAQCATFYAESMDGHDENCSRHHCRCFACPSAVCRAAFCRWRESMVAGEGVLRICARQ
jgi:hypothetical protein